MSAPIVTITDSFDAIVDGQNWGKFGDVVVNNSGNAELLVAVNRAVTAKADEMRATLAERDATIAANAQAVADARAVLMTEDERKAAALQATIDQASAQLSKLTAAKGVSIGAAGAAKAV